MEMNGPEPELYLGWPKAQLHLKLLRYMGRDAPVGGKSALQAATRSHCISAAHALYIVETDADRHP